MNKAHIASPPPAIAVSGLTKRFGFMSALDDIDLQIEQGEFLALFGPNGAGKTTLLRILSSLSRPTLGTIRLLGYDPVRHGEQVRAQVGVLGHSPLLIPTLTAHENLKFYGQMFGIKQLNQRIGDLLRQVGLFEQRTQIVETFSRGMQQRLAIARAILHRPKMLLLDEPFSGLDQDGIALLKHILRDFLQEGKTVIMTEHDFPRGLELCTKIVILDHGSLLYSSEPSKLEEPFELVYRKYVD